MLFNVLIQEERVRLLQKLKIVSVNSALIYANNAIYDIKGNASNNQLTVTPFSGLG